MNQPQPRCCQLCMGRVCQCCPQCFRPRGENTVIPPCSCQAGELPPPPPAPAPPKPRTHVVQITRDERLVARVLDVAMAATGLLLGAAIVGLVATLTGIIGGATEPPQECSCPPTR